MGQLTASIILVSRQSREDLRECLPSLLAEPSVEQEIVLVDNASTDGTPEFVAQDYPEVRMLRSAENRGFAWACNRGAEMARGGNLVFLNCDTVVEPGWLGPLMGELADGTVGACMPRILLHGTELVNTMGSRVHWSGLTWMDRWGEPDPGPGRAEEVFGASGCALAIRAEPFREVGGFCEDFFMYHEDVDLCWRLRLRGYRVVVVAQAVIHHKYSFTRNRLKWHLAERNRLQMILTNYRCDTLLLLTPALAAMEVAMWFYAARNRLLQAKWGAARDLLRDVPKVARRRREVQATRRVGDGAIWRRLSSSRSLWQASRQYHQAAG